MTVPENPTPGPTDHSPAEAPRASAASAPSEPTGEPTVEPTAGTEGGPEGNPAPAQPQTWGEVWATMKPWKDRPTRLDKILFGSIFGITAFYLVMMPFRPFMIAKAPVLLELVTGGKTVIGAAGAFAGVGEVSLWVVILAGTIGSAKFDWIFWLAGRRWGEGIMRLFAGTEHQQKWVARLRSLPSWVLVLLVFIAPLPGVPAALVMLVAGWNGMRLWAFLAANVASSAVVASIMAWIGYAIGQPAVDLVGQIDKYAIFVSIAIVFGLAFWGSWKASRAQQKQEKAEDAGATDSAKDASG